MVIFQRFFVSLEKILIPTIVVLYALINNQSTIIWGYLSTFLYLQTF